MGLHILVVEDDPEFRALMTIILSEWGHQVVEAGTVAEAVAVATTERPTTVLTDVGLPDGNGLDLTARLLAMPWALRVIVVSSDSSAGTAAAALAAGAAGFLPKDELFSDAMRRLLDADGTRGAPGAAV